MQLKLLSHRATQGFQYTTRVLNVETPSSRACSNLTRNHTHIRTHSLLEIPSIAHTSLKFPKPHASLSRVCYVVTSLHQFSKVSRNLRVVGDAVYRVRQFPKSDVSRNNVTRPQDFQPTFAATCHSLRTKCDRGWVHESDECWRMTGARGVRGYENNS